MRTDRELREDVERALEADRGVDETRLGESIEHAIVTLTGEVSSYAQKWNAERAVEHVAGVRGVANEIEVRGPQPYSDTDLAKAAADTVSRLVTRPEDRVTVEVDHGWVTLSGHVDYAEPQVVEESIRYLMGVRGITNLIAFRPHTTAEELKKQIEAAFNRCAALDAGRITVTIEHGQVTLEGIVHSSAERREAERTAWHSPGVQSVTNHLTVSAS